MKIYKRTVEDIQRDVDKVREGVKIVKRVKGDRVLIVYNENEHIVRISDLLYNHPPSILTALDKTSFFINASKKVHGNKYDYTSTVYVKAKQKVKITCPIHGDFLQSPKDHLRGRGCKICGRINSNKGSWTYSEWEEAGKRSKNFSGYQLYILECWNKNEHFYKVGKTFVGIKARYKGNRDMPYKYRVLYTTKGNAREVSIKETEILSNNKDSKYSPRLVFNGKTECFSSLKEL